MDMKDNYTIIASGSSGNAIVIRDKILLDCGVSFKQLKGYYKKLQLVFISHIHLDHFNKTTIKKLAFERPNLKFCVGSYLIQELIDLGVNKKNIFVLNFPNIYDLGSIKVQCFELSHDVINQAFLITFKKDNFSVFYAVDTNSLEGISAKNCSLYLVEANFEDEEIEKRIENKLLNGEYIHEFRTINTHLSKEKAYSFLLDNMGKNSEFELIHRHIENEE